MTTKELKNRRAVLSSQEIIKDISDHLAVLNRNLVSDEFEESLRYLSKYINLKVHRKTVRWGEPVAWDTINE